MDKPGLVARVTSNLSWSEGLRALLCMLPMLVAVLIGQMTYIVALGQGGFFFSSLLLPNRISGRLIMGSILIALGMGFYLMGGTVAPTPWLAVVFTFFAALNLSFLTSWRIGGPLALSIVMIYTAGLNTGSPEKAAANFLAFALVMAWATLVSMLPVWKPMMPPKPKHDPTNSELAEQGFRMGIGTSLALAVSFIFEFAKIGWAVSAVGSIVRFDPTCPRGEPWPSDRYRRRSAHRGLPAGENRIDHSTGAHRCSLRGAQRPVQEGEDRADAALLYRDHSDPLQPERI